MLYDINSLEFAITEIRLRAGQIKICDGKPEGLIFAVSHNFNQPVESVIFVVLVLHPVIT